MSNNDVQGNDNDFSYTNGQDRSDDTHDPLYDWFLKTYSPVRHFSSPSPYSDIIPSPVDHSRRSFDDHDIRTVTGTTTGTATGATGSADPEGPMKIGMLRTLESRSPGSQTPSNTNENEDESALSNPSPLFSSPLPPLSPLSDSDDDSGDSGGMEEDAAEDDDDAEEVARPNNKRSRPVEQETQVQAQAQVQTLDEAQERSHEQNRQEPETNSGVTEEPTRKKAKRTGPKPPKIPVQQFSGLAQPNNPIVNAAKFQQKGCRDYLTPLFTPQTTDRPPTSLVVEFKAAKYAKYSTVRFEYRLLPDPKARHHSSNSGQWQTAYPRMKIVSEDLNYTFLPEDAKALNKPRPFFMRAVLTYGKPATDQAPTDQAPADQTLDEHEPELDGDYVLTYFGYVNGGAKAKGRSKVYETHLRARMMEGAMIGLLSTNQLEQLTQADLHLLLN